MGNGLYSLPTTARGETYMKYRIARLALQASTALALGIVLIAAVPAPAPDSALIAAVSDPARTATFVARDKARHPAEELAFFGITPKMTVIELWPGGGYWTEILGPYLAKGGTYYAALNAPGDKEEDAGVQRWRARVAAQKDRLGTIHETMLGAGHFDIGPPGSADLIVTFRNLHNVMEDGTADQALAAAFKALKPGGILGIEEHRGRADKPQDPKAKDGYVREDYAVALVKKAGFVLVGSSEINANPKDTKDWVDGVWTLPPTLSQKDKDREKYIAVGEADNFVLRFQKPKT
jgi:predicted methyltransferase